MQTILVGREFLAEDFDGDFAPELHVFGQIDHAHAARAKLLEDSVMGNFFGVHLYSRTLLWLKKAVMVCRATAFRQWRIERARGLIWLLSGKYPTIQASESFAGGVPAAAQSHRLENALSGLYS